MKFLEWLYLRLKNKYHEDHEILYQLKSILDSCNLVDKKIDTDFVDDICRKHFIDFDMEKTPDLQFGFSEQDRCRYRNFVLDIVGTLTKP